MNSEADKPNARPLTGYEPTPEPRPKRASLGASEGNTAKTEPRVNVIGDADRRLAVHGTIKKMMRRYLQSASTATLARLTGLAVQMLDDYADKADYYVQNDEAAKIVGFVSEGLWLDPDTFTLKPGRNPNDPHDGNINAPPVPVDTVPTGPAMPKELPAAPYSVVVSVTQPTLTRHEATAAFNVLRGIFEPTPIRAIRDALRVTVEWNTASDRFIGERLDMIVEILFVNAVLFNAPDTTRPGTSLIRTAADGLDWLKNQATRTY